MPYETTLIKNLKCKHIHVMLCKSQVFLFPQLRFVFLLRPLSWLFGSMNLIFLSLEANPANRAGGLVDKLAALALRLTGSIHRPQPKFSVIQ